MLQARSGWVHHASKSRALSTIKQTYLSNTRSEPELLQTVRALCARDQLHDALSLFYDAPTPDSQTYATLLHTCARLGCLADGRAVHQRHTCATLNHHQRPDIFVTNHVINMYAKCGCLVSARKVFDEMPQRNIVSWTALISGYDQHGCADDCFRLFASMIPHHFPTEFAFASVLSSCNRERGQQVHALALKSSFDAYLYVGNALISMYNKSCDGDLYGHISKIGDDALRVFENMPIRNGITWNSMISGFQLRGLVGQALEFFSQMHREGIGFDRSTFVSALASLRCVQYCYQLHCLIVKIGLVSEIEVFTALGKAYSTTGEDLSECYKLFLETNTSTRDIVAWTSLMTIFSEQAQEEALHLFKQLLSQNIEPDHYTFSIVIKACAGLPCEQHAAAIHALVVKHGLEGETVLENALIHAYSRCGSIELSMQVFNCMRIRDVVSWNSMFKACSVHGLGNEALNLFAQMNISPDAATFVALLSACSHAGLVDEGMKIFNSMFESHRIVPQCDHYACVIDILGRAGRLLEAEALINQMPIEPDAVVWSALLGACRKHGETKIAELASMKLLELEPKSSLGYVSIANLYCSKGVFNDAALVRTKMKVCKVRKEPGLSWIEIGNMVHEFAAGGWQHPEREAINTKLKRLIGSLKEIGYAPEVSVALHDTEEEEQKEEQLYYHSEKLALAFALIHSDTWFNGGRVLRIIKNIRICVDCHNFMKLASEFVKREIMVRDANRFHHFRSGTCSCKDYW